MVQANTTMINTDDQLSFEGYMARFENSNMYFTKLEDLAKSSRVPIDLRGKAINMAIARAKVMKKVG